MLTFRTMQLLTGSQLRSRRLRAGISRERLAHEIGVPITAVAEWENGKLTVWFATQNPFGVRDELLRAFRLDENAVRVVVPDFGSS